jgi:hypothetical protein
MFTAYLMEMYVAPFCFEHSAVGARVVMHAELPFGRACAGPCSSRCYLIIHAKTQLLVDYIFAYSTLCQQPAHGIH